MSSSYPYTAKATVKYKSPHATDLSFVKGETIRVTGVSDDDEDWLLGESIDGSRVGGFPRDFVEQVEEPEESIPTATTATSIQQEAEPSVPVMKSAEPPSQPLPEADAIPGSFNPEPVQEPRSEPTAIIDPPSDKSEAIQKPSQITSTSSISSPAPQIASSTSRSNAETLSSDTPEPSKLSFKDRLAAFNKPKDASPVSGARGPPPALKPKPAGVAGLTWSQRQKLREEEEKRAKESEGSGETGQVAAQSTSAAPESAASPAAVNIEQTQSPAATTSAEEKTGMSASDAKASIGLSLKERMAALQGSQAFGGAGIAPASDVPTSPSETTGKKPPARTWKRPEVDEGSLPIPGQMPMPGMGRSNSARSTEGANQEAVALDERGEAAGEVAGAIEGGEVEEQKEKERRAAIAARMARLGGRGMFGGPPPLAPKPVAIDTETVESQTTNLSSSPVDQQRSAEPITSPVEPQVVSADQVAAPGGGIAMPAIPRRAAGPRRRGGAATSGAGPSRSESLVSGTGSEQVMSPGAEASTEEGPQMAKETPAAPNFVSPSAGAGLSTVESAQQRSMGEQAGAGPQGAEGAEAAGIALATPPSPSQPPAAVPIGIENVGGEDLARHGDGPILIGAEGGADSNDRGTLNQAILQGSSARMPSMPPPPPPPPPGGFDSDEDVEQSEDEGEDDLLRQAKSGKMHAQPSRIDVDEQDLASPRSPVAFAPLQAPADDQPEAINRQHMSSPSTAGPGNSGLASLGLPRDEIEMKHDQDEEEEAPADDGEDNNSFDEDDDAPPPPPRADRPADKPAGPRPMPNPPVLGQTAVPEQVIQLESQKDESDSNEPAPAPPPRRRETLEKPTQVDVALPQGSKDIFQAAPVSDPPILSEEPAPAVVDDNESARRQNIAARMAKLGGIKLGGPPMFNPRQASDSTDNGPLSPTNRPQTPGSPRAEGPMSPTSPIMSRNTALETGGDDDETDEAAALRRRATLARLQAGGHLGGFNMFSRNVESQSPTAENTNMEPVPPSPAPRVDERNLQAEEEVGDGYSAEPGMNEADAVVDIEDLDEAPPPPPRRPEQMASPPLSPQGDLPPSPLLARTGTLRSASQQSSGTGLPEAPPSAGLAAPIPIEITNTISEEPQTMSRLETTENEDEVGPPPPPRIDTTAPPAHQRSDSRASRVSIGSRHSSQAVPASPTTPRRTSMQTGRPAYNELQQASSTFGSKVYRAAQKLADAGRRQSVGDGSSRAFVWTALGEAGIDANNSFGTLIWEQEGSTQNKRYDDIRVGDVIVLHDAKLKGKKGLVPYNQQVGSVEEPMFAICSETEHKKNKVKVWQVDRGHITSESYRLEDLQSGLVRAFRPM